MNGWPIEISKRLLFLIVAGCLATVVGIGKDGVGQELIAPPPIAGRTSSPSPSELPPPRVRKPRVTPLFPEPDLPKGVAPSRTYPSPVFPTPAGDFPALPPDPAPEQEIFLPPLEEELAIHGGSYLYQTEQQKECSGEIPRSKTELRLGEDWFAPQPFTLGAPFLGTGAINYFPKLHWPGTGYYWEPRFVGYGGYQLFGFSLEENGQRQDAVGSQLLVELDLRFTGTERFHVQFRPIGKQNSGGSYYQFNNPEGYVDNSTAAPDRYWFEGELHSMLGDSISPFVPADINIVAGRYPMNLHNGLLINDDVTGVALSKNNFYVGDFSNLNLQSFYGHRNPLDGRDTDVFGTTAFIDYQRAYWEATYAYSADSDDSNRDAHYLALSATQFFGRWTFAGRAMCKFGDEAGTGDGQLFVFESNMEQILDQPKFGIEEVIYYINGFAALDGWTSLGGGNFNRLTSAFEVNPLVQISAGGAPGTTTGVVGGMQMFRHHQDESIIPEIAFESRDGVAVFGAGLRYLRKTSARSFLEVYGVLNSSDDIRYRREGVFLSHNWLF